MEFLLGAEGDEGRPRRRAKGNGNGKGGGRRRRRRRNRGGFLAPLLAFIVLAGILGGGGYFGYQWVSGALVPDDFTGQGSGDVVIEITDGQSASDVAEELQKKGVVASARAFTNAIGNAGKSASLLPGEYTLRKGMSAANAVKLLDSGNQMLVHVTIKEGLRLSDTLTQLAQKTGKPEKDFVAAAKNTRALDLPSYAKGKLEGYAFPATYDFRPKSTPAEILSTMVERYKQAADDAGLEASAKTLGRSAHDIMTIASIVQAEAGRHEDMPKIARVIYNRLSLKPPMMLKMDSTLMYGLGKYRTSATAAELLSPTKYNTYKYYGLPPGPISNPGDAAIDAALNPAKGDWLYFAATDPKSSVTKFATTDAQFQVLLQELRANGG